MKRHGILHLIFLVNNLMIGHIFGVKTKQQAKIGITVRYFFSENKTYFTILLFDGLDASVHTANAASRIMETQDLMLLCSLSYIICC
jgi:hypothetical protein